MTRWLGIDPGLKGGLALYDTATPHLVLAADIPVAGSEVDTDTLAALICEWRPDVAMIERVASRPGQGVVSVFKFGAAYGAARATVSVLKVPAHLVAPGVWKKHFRLSPDKEQSRALALRLWPGCGLFALKKHKDRAEAALIARYGAETNPLQEESSHVAA